MLDETFTAVLEKGTNKGSWTRVVWPKSADFFKTKGIVKIKGEIDGYPFQATFVAMGGGVHMLPIKAEIRKAIGKDVGEQVTIHLTERLA